MIKKKHFPISIRAENSFYQEQHPRTYCAGFVEGSSDAALDASICLPLEPNILILRFAF